jgi:hypothetical protein
MLQQPTRASVKEFKEKRRVASNTCKKKKTKWENERLLEIQNDCKEKQTRKYRHPSLSAVDWFQKNRALSETALPWI